MSLGGSTPYEGIMVPLMRELWYTWGRFQLSTKPLSFEYRSAVRWAILSVPEVVNKQLIILMPVSNDWDALRLLLPALANELSANGLRAAILLVDDGSTVLPSKNLCE